MASTLGHCSFRRFAYSKPTGPNHPMGPSSPPPFATSRSHSSAPGSGDTVRYAPTVSFHDPGVLLYHAVSGAQSILKLGTPRLLPQREGTTNRPVQQLMTTAEIPAAPLDGGVGDGQKSKMERNVCSKTDALTSGVAGGFKKGSEMCPGTDAPGRRKPLTDETTLSTPFQSDHRPSECLTHCLNASLPCTMSA
eukprot:CAMPEP_0114117922 /NCGR_PEP_ID=MMETSP0043_2-20121206/5304_1 /TAXON_ID=464988 /ORGANISM="Hemiselmis andersenii, Strain CCMP644" /LENGTH=192 /DNA_ID=CAMNT_0001210371 /DNA_START=69 /DNA_END=648 /DNA_ORIENTATION=+